MLPPLEKCSPTARRTITRTRGSSSIASNTSRNWSRCGISMMLNGGRSRTTSARSRCGSISTRKPPSLARRGSANVINVLIVLFSIVIRMMFGDIARGPIITGNELAPQKLADRRFWNLRNKYVAARTFEVYQSQASAECIEIIGLHRGARLDESANDLTPACVRQSDHGDFRYCRVQRQAAFDLDWRDVLAAGDDHIIDAAGNEKIAVGVHQSGVAGKIPAVANSGVGVGAT